MKHSYGILHCLYVLCFVPTVFSIYYHLRIHGTGTCLTNAVSQQNRSTSCPKVHCNKIYDADVTGGEPLTVNVQH